MDDFQDKYKRYTNIAKYGGLGVATVVIVPVLFSVSFVILSTMAVASAAIVSAFVTAGLGMAFVNFLPVMAMKFANWKLKGVYSQQTVVYENLSTAGVPTVAVDSLLVVNNYRSSKMKAALGTLRECMKTSVDDIAETPKTHPAWRDIAKQFNTKPRWDLYDPK